MATTVLTINSFDEAAGQALPPATRSLIERRKRVLGPSYKLFYEEPVHFVRGRGVLLFDPEGRDYLDCYNNVPAVGHCHPRVVEAVARQMATLNTHTRYLYDNVVDYAERLLATFPPALGNLMLTCTGSEATDLAMRIARFVTGGSGFVVTEHAYHGITLAASSISPSMGRGVPIGQHVRTVPAPDAYRGGPDAGAAFARDVARAIAELERHGIRFAGLFCDTIFSSDGVHPGPAGFLAEAADVARRAGGLFVADEVQPGFGRTGGDMWGFARHGLVPDLAVLGKPMGNGLPIAGVVARPELLAEFGPTVQYFNTFGGNPVCVAAAMAVLDVIAEEGLMANAADVGGYLLAGIRRLAAQHEGIGDVRGAGLFLGVEFVADRAGKAPDADAALAVVNGLRRRRILISAAGVHGNVLKIRPPLPFSRADADRFLAALAEVLEERAA